MKNPRAWSLLAVDGDRQYGGNTGYQDDPSQVYRYDSFVANHKQVSVDDVVIVRSKSEVIGIARVTRIEVGKGNKVRQRCPTCNASTLKYRSTMSPSWACHNRHEFDDPAIESVPVDTYSAEYGATFRPAPNELTPERLADAVIRPSDQMSIKEIDLARIDSLLMANAECLELVIGFSKSITIDNVAPSKQETLPQSIIDARRRVLREVLLRRGQRQFRERLIKRYGAACQISGCDFPGLVEAAHIHPYSQGNENGVHNGLLLRSDLHTLFDLDLLAVHPTELNVRLHPSLLEAGYAEFEGTILFVNETAGPDRTALLQRWERFKALLEPTA